jgi:predicted nicotinamide N-methyase
MNEPIEIARFANEVECFEQISERIASEFTTISETIQLVSQRGTDSLDILKVADPAGVFDALAEDAERAGSDELSWEPYWAEAWESAVGVGQKLLDMDLAGLSVLDLGCGIGIAGAVAAKRGANVVMADAAPPSLLFARLNSWPWRERVTVNLCDWQSDILAARPFDLIIGADILYEQKQWSFLDSFWRNHLHRNAEVLLGEPGRLIDGKFQKWAEGRGWTVQLEHAPVVGRERPIRLYRLRAG